MALLVFRESNQQTGLALQRRAELGQRLNVNAGKLSGPQAHGEIVRHTSGLRQMVGVLDAPLFGYLFDVNRNHRGISYRKSLSDTSVYCKYTEVYTFLLRDSIRKCILRPLAN